jgi:hypothetical protein
MTSKPTVTRYRAYRKAITCCNDCPECWYHSKDECDRCAAVRDGIDDKIIPDPRTIPDWCPLDDLISPQHCYFDLGPTRLFVVGCCDLDEDSVTCLKCGCREGSTCSILENLLQCVESSIRQKVLMEVRSVKCPQCGTVFGFEEPKRKIEGLL